MKTALIILLGVAGCADILDIPDRQLASESKCSGTIRIKALFDASGPTADVGLSWYKATMDSIREINTTGGIKGCTIDVDPLDYSYSRDAALAAYAGWKADPSWDGIVAILGWGTNDSLPLASLVKMDKKPYISASYFASLASPNPVQHNETIYELSDTSSANPFAEVAFDKHFSSDGFPYNFFAGTDYSTGARVGMFHVHRQGGARIGFFHCTADYCTGALPAARSYAREQGVGLGRDLILELTDTQDTYNTKVAQYFREEKAHQAVDTSYAMVDWVWSGNTTKTTSFMAKALANMKMLAATDTTLPPPNTNIQLMANVWGIDEQLFGLCGPVLNNPCADRVHGTLPFAAYGDTRAADMAKVTALHDKWRIVDGETATYKNVRYVQGYVNVLIFRKAVERVIASGLSITGENIKTALETFRSEPTGGLTDNLTYTEDDHRPQGTESVYKIDGSGKLVIEGDPRSIAMKDEWKGW
jgi:branched-chain amino acid transport system substrate-binding protein